MNDSLKKFLERLKNDWKPELTKQYKVFPIIKNGKRRIISQPINELNTKLTELYINIFSKYVFRKIISCSKRRGLIYHIKPHTHKDYVITLDIKDCFPSTRFSIIKESLRKAFELNSNESQLLSLLVTRKNSLPQGSVTSTFICNLCLENILQEVSEKADQLGVNITVYVDDIAISGPVQESIDIFNDVISTLRKNGYRTKKIKKYFKNQLQIINGIVVNDKPRPNENFLKGIDLSYSELISNLPIIDFKELNKLKGKISFCKSVSKKLGNEWEMKVKKSFKNI